MSLLQSVLFLHWISLKEYRPKHQHTIPAEQPKICGIQEEDQSGISLVDGSVRELEPSSDWGPWKSETSGIARL